jgi:hypothetical protein
MRGYLLIPVLAIVAFVGLAFSGVKHTSADERDFMLVNRSHSVTIVHAYVSPSQVNDWEEDVLGDAVLFPGDSIRIHFSKFDRANTCYYDIRVDGDGGEQGYLWGLDLCNLDYVTFS